MCGKTGGSYVIDSRASYEQGSIRRRRGCKKCGNRFTTYETTILAVQSANEFRSRMATISADLSSLQRELGKMLEILKKEPFISQVR